jgi:hypothetical protein
VSDGIPAGINFVGLGELRADQLASLAETRLRVTDAQFRWAQAAWHAFTSPDPTAIERFIETDTSALPFIATALRRHLEQSPSVDSGLSRTERQALSVLHEHGSLSGRRLFTAVQRLEEQVFMGNGRSIGSRPICPPFGSRCFSFRTHRSSVSVKSH